MTVAELIEVLKSYPQDLPVAYQCYSEQVLLETNELRIKNLCESRNDGWLANERPDKPSFPYLVFPGN